MHEYSLAHASVRSGVCIMRVIAAYYALVLGPASGGQASVLVEDRAVIVLIL